MLDFPSFSLKGRVSLVTGGSRGIGYAMALGLANAGSHVIILGRDRASGETAVDELRQLGSNAYFIQADVKDEPGVCHAIQWIENEIGSIDILVNNAGKNIRKEIVDYTIEDWNEVIDTNLRGIFLVGREAIRVMKQRKRGKVINISSIFGSVAMPSQTAYAASKGGIIQLTKVWALECAPYGINVNAIAPAYIKTPMTEQWLEDPERQKDILSRTPAKRLGELRDLIGPVVFLSSDSSDFVHGHVLYVDGGWTAQ